MLKPTTGDRFSAKKQTVKRNNKQERLKEAAKSCKNITTFFKPVTRDKAKTYGRNTSLPSQQDSNMTQDISSNMLYKQSTPQHVPKFRTVFTQQRSHYSESNQNQKSSDNLAHD